MSEWRYRCPEGHASIQTLNPESLNNPPEQTAVIYCKSCRCSYDAKVDAKTGERITSSKTSQTHAHTRARESGAD